MRIFRIAVVAAALSMGFAVSVASAGVAPTDIALGVTVQTDIGTTSVLTDGTVSTQFDSGVGAPANPGNVPYTAVVFSGAKTFNSIMFADITSPTYIAQGKTFEVANVASPDPANNTDWTPITGGTITGNSTQNWFNYTGTTYTSWGVRVLYTDTSNTPDNKARPHEIYVWDKWGTNLALTANTYENPTTSLTSSINDENFNNQAYGGTTIASGPDAGDHHQGYEWSTPQSIAAVLIAGGTGGETLNTFHLEYLDSDNITWLDVPGASVTGNTGSLNSLNFAPIETTGLRVVISSDNNDGLDRISEFAVFAPLPEPTTLAMLALGSLLTLRRRRRV